MIDLQAVEALKQELSKMNKEIDDHNWKQERVRTERVNALKDAGVESEEQLLELIQKEELSLTQMMTEAQEYIATSKQLLNEVKQ